MASHLQFCELFSKNKTTRLIAGHNVHSNVLNQYGGTGITISRSISTLVLLGKDKSGLGCAMWMHFNNEGCKLQVVTTYTLFHKPSRSKQPRRKWGGAAVYVKNKESLILYFGIRTSLFGG